MEDFKLIEYIKGDGNSVDNARVEEWINASEQNRDRYIQFQNIWVITGIGNSSSEVNFDDEKKAILRKIKVKKWELKQWLKLASALAAILLVGSFSYWLGQQSEQGEVKSFVMTTGIGETAVLKLPDGSSVKLNAESHLTYDSDFNVENRNLKLEGEAYFDVVRNQYIPFIVNTFEMKVAALGTRFNVMAYKNDCSVEATLEEGKIKVTTNKSRKEYFLTPGTKLIYQKSKKRLLRKAVNTKFSTSWKDGVLAFKDERLGMIAKKLERIYGVSFQFDKKEAYNYRYNGDFDKSQSINEVMKIISIPTQLKYEIKNRKVIVK